ncbi:MAG: C40 family peptidase [Caulobacteraceae bacterium]
MSQFKKLLFFGAVLVLLFGLSTATVYAAENKTVSVTASALNLRKGPSTSKSIVVTLKKGLKLTVIDQSNGWYKVKTPAGTLGWVIGTYVTSSGTTAARGNVTRTLTAATSSVSSEVISFAKKYLGVKYVWGGESPSGFDCSGFVYYVFKHFGFGMERTASSQASQGEKIGKSELKPGDLVFFDTNGGHNKINHVGIYIGGGKFIQSSSGSSAHKVVISNLTSGFYADAYMTARRLI